MQSINPEAIVRLKAYRHKLTAQQYKTLRGQVLAGNPEAAMNGLQKILKRYEREKYDSGA